MIVVVQLENQSFHVALALSKLLMKSTDEVARNDDSRAHWVRSRLVAVDSATRFRRREAVHRVENNRTRHQESLQSGPHIPVWSASPRRDLILEECALYAQLLKAVKNRKGISVWTLFLRYCCLSQFGEPRGKVVSKHVHAFQYVINYTHTFTHRSILLLTYSIALSVLHWPFPFSPKIYTPLSLCTHPFNPLSKLCDTWNLLKCQNSLWHLLYIYHDLLYHTPPHPSLARPVHITLQLLPTRLHSSNWSTIRTVILIRESMHLRDTRVGREYKYL